MFNPKRYPSSTQGEPSGELYRSAVWKFTLSLRDGGQGPLTTNAASSPTLSSFEGSGAVGVSPLPYHKFRMGDSVLITQYDHQTPRDSHQGAARRSSSAGGAASQNLLFFEGAVLELRRGHLMIALDPGDAEQMDMAVRKSRVSLGVRRRRNNVICRMDK